MMCFNVVVQAFLGFVLSYAVGALLLLFGDAQFVLHVFLQKVLGREFFCAVLTLINYCFTFLIPFYYFMLVVLELEVTTLSVLDPESVL